jgi:hypothetical protein
VGERPREEASVVELQTPLCFVAGVGVVVAYCGWVVRKMLKRLR